jgi:hypothetical protein
MTNFFFASKQNGPAHEVAPSGGAPIAHATRQRLGASWGALSGE